MLDSVRLGEKTGPVAVTGWQDRLYFAWTGHSRNPVLDWKLIVAYSPDGREIMGKRRLAQRGYGMMHGGGHRRGPSLAVSGDQLYLAWTGSDGHINILADPESPHGGPIRPAQAWSQQFEPALCSHQGNLVLAWTGHDYRINILAGPESPRGAPVRLDEARSHDRPALCSHQGSLVLAWTGHDQCINILAGPESLPGAPVRLDEARSPERPALCSHQGRLVLAWCGIDGHLNLARLR